jgi:uncharacterized protein YcbX
MVSVARILVYPIKSFDGIEVATAAVRAGGNLDHDRQFALVDRAGLPVNGKRDGRVHRLVLECDPARRTVFVARRDRSMEPVSFDLDGDREELELWLSEYFDQPVSIVENRETGFPDDTIACGPTVISRATLEAVASWHGLALDECRRRFRANIELEAPEPFWEDRLFAGPDSAVRFQIGDVTFEGTNPCARCVVPMRDSRSGRRDERFRQTFTARREAELPAWADRRRFDHFYRLAVNTRPAPGVAGGRIGVGDEVVVG